MARPDAVVEVLSLGHGSRRLDELLDLLALHRVRCLADVRRFPTSRRHPHFGANALAAALGEAGIDYVRLGDELGGFRGEPYERYARTPAFRSGLERLEGLARARRTAFLCAEKLPWRCHRWHIARALGERGLRVVHVIDRGTVWSDDEPWLRPPGASGSITR